MTSGDTPTGAARGTPPSCFSELAHELGRQSRMLHLLKTHMSSWAPAGLDWAAFGLLMTLAKCGPCRQSELAGVSMLDPSTVSRHVGQLVRTGMARRQADPADGRAVQLVATEQGLSLAGELVARREQLLTGILIGWNEQDAATLLRLMRRLNDGIEAGLEVGLHEPTRPGPNRPGQARPDPDRRQQARPAARHAPSPAGQHPIPTDPDLTQQVPAVALLPDESPRRPPVVRDVQHADPQEI